MNELALFAGAGGGLLASDMLGIRTVCAVERNAYAASVLAQRQNDGIFKPFPIWDDVRSFNGRDWNGHIDLVSGGFPCQDISSAGRGVGIDGSRSGLWKQFHRIISEVQPDIVFMENSPLLIRRGLAVVIGDLAEIGYDIQWLCLSAQHCGANHKRDRFWGMAYPAGKRQQGSGKFIDSCYKKKNSNREAGESFDVRFRREWPTEPDLGRVADGVAYRMERLTAIGNGQVPRVAASAFLELYARCFE